MSTKTSIKRIALVAVSALGFGLLAVAPAKAATDAFDLTVAEYIAADAKSGVQVAGALNFVKFEDNAVAADADTSWTVKVSGAGASISAVTGGFTNAADKLSASTGLNQALAAQAITVATPTAGTLKFEVYKNVVNPATGIYTVTLEESLTVTVNAAATGGVPVAANSTSIIDKDAANAAGFNAAADDTVLAARTAAGLVGVIKVVAKDGNSALLPDGKTITATISGPGLLGGGVADIDTYANSSKSESVTTAGGTGQAWFGVYGDGTAGKATVTITSGGVTLGTETVVFYGTVASLTATQLLYSLADNMGPTAFVKITAADADGNVVPIQAADGTASAANGTFSDANNGATAVNVLLDPAADTLGTKSTVWTHTATSVSINVSVVVAEALATGTQVTKLATDKSSYAPGEKVTVTVTSVDASGNIMADGAGQALFAAGGVTSNTALQGTLPGANVDLVNGKATYTIYAPLLAGNVTLNGTSTSTAAEAVTASFAVVADTTATDAATAAADAAAEAIDAANAATDAANLAAEAADAATVAAEEARDAADAATAAVEELATQVATLMAALKAQITTLANTVAKIAKKVRA